MKYNKHLDALKRVVNTTPPDRSLVRMHAGERTESFHDSFFETFLSTLTQRDFIEYPDVTELRNKLAAKHNVKPSNIFISPGSDYALAALFYAFVEPGTSVLMPEARFPMYDVYLAQCQGTAIEMKYTMVDGKHKLNVGYVPGAAQGVRMVVVGNPNSPVGDVLTIDEFSMLERFECPIVVDQAYGEFGKTDLSIELIEKNYVFVNTFSKGFGAAGIRVGYAVANEKIIELMGKYRLMFEVTGVSAKFAEYLLDHQSVLDEYIVKINAEREKLKSIGVHVNGGNWVHLHQAYANRIHKYTFKHGVRLPHVEEPLIRINIFEGISDILKEL
jgi:histidinol-phosphate aminotransferase